MSADRDGDRMGKEICMGTLYLVGMEQGYEISNWKKDIRYLKWDVGYGECRCCEERM